MDWLRMTPFCSTVIFKSTVRLPALQPFGCCLFEMRRRGLNELRHSLWLVDENLERTAPMGLMLAMRVSRPETFAMTCGVMVPVDATLIETVLEEVQGRVRGEPAAIANDRRFATAIYRIAVMSGIMDQIGFASPG